MGKNLIQQRRGKGSIFKKLSHRSKGKATQPSPQAGEGVVMGFTTSVAHTAPLMHVRFENEERLMIAPEGVRMGQNINTGECKVGNTLSLQDIPEGTSIYNIELSAGDGGKLVRSGGAFARLQQKTDKGVVIILPSKKTKLINPSCRATIGVAAGGGRVEKPMMKAGNSFKRARARHEYWPKVCGISMNAVAHPFGSKGSHTKGRPTQVSRHAPPGRKVGKIAPKRTGMKR